MISQNLKQTEEIAKNFLEKIVANDDGATTIGLYGDLGSGKTTFTQNVAKLLGIKDFVTSPTYVIEKKYPIKYKNFENLIHIDLYRIESSKELLHLDWEEIISNPKNLILIEWPEKIGEIMPKDTIRVSFKFVTEDEREIEY